MLGYAVQAILRLPLLGHYFPFFLASFFSCSSDMPGYALQFVSPYLSFFRFV